MGQHRTSHKPTRRTGRRTPIVERIKAALAHGYVELGTLERMVFPHDDFPNAFRAAVQGGPPACRRVLVAALKRYDVPIWIKEPNAASLIGPYPGTTIPVEVYNPFAKPPAKRKRRKAA